MRLTTENCMIPLNNFEKAGIKLSQLEDIEEELGKLTFYGKILQYPNELMKLHFLRVYFGGENTTDIRIEFEVKDGFGNVFYHIFDYGKTWALTKKELL